MRTCLCQHPRTAVKIRFWTSGLFLGDCFFFFASIFVCLWSGLTERRSKLFRCSMPLIWVQLQRLPSRPLEVISQGDGGGGRWLLDGWATETLVLKGWVCAGLRSGNATASVRRVPESCRSWLLAHAAHYWLHEQQEACSDKEADAPTTFLNGTVISADLFRLFHSFMFRGQMFLELCPESKHDFQKIRNSVYFTFLIKLCVYLNQVCRWQLALDWTR